MKLFVFVSLFGFGKMRERERENEREVRGYIYGILMADKEIKTKGFCEAFLFC